MKAGGGGRTGRKLSVYQGTAEFTEVLRMSSSSHTGCAQTEGNDLCIIFVSGNPNHRLILAHTHTIYNPHTGLLEYRSSDEILVQRQTESMCTTGRATNHSRR